MAALDATPGVDPALATGARDLRARLLDLRIDLVGDPTLARRNEPQPPSILGRVQHIVSGSWTSTAAPTASTLTFKASLYLASSLMVSGCMMFDDIGWHEVSTLIKDAFTRTVAAGIVTYDFARQMDDATLVSCSGFGDALIAKM